MWELTAQRRLALNQILQVMLGSEELVERWWESPNRAFDGLTPLQADPELVRDYVLWHGFMAGG
jgi:hypothetical protein